MTGPEHPCYHDGEWGHEWEFVDDSFDHEYGTEVRQYMRCERCDAQAECESDEDEYY